MSSEAKKKYKKTPTGKGIIDPDMRDYSNDPVFIKKAERSREMIKKYGIPEEFLKGSKNTKNTK